jgi:hypothetical protein
MDNLLPTLLLGGLMGLLGQGARAVIGLKGMADDARALQVSPDDLFQAARLLISLAIGFLVGLAAAVIYIATGADLKTPDWHILLNFVGAGYLGTDFLEGFISQYLPAGKQAAAALGTRGGATSQGATNTLQELTNKISTLPTSEAFSALSDKVDAVTLSLARTTSKTIKLSEIYRRVYSIIKPGSTVQPSDKVSKWWANGNWTLAVVCMKYQPDFSVDGLQLQKKDVEAESASTIAGFCNCVAKWYTDSKNWTVIQD